MFELLLLSPLVFIIIFPGLLISLSLHELAHAYMADRLGDPTPRIQGRLTLNPLAHLDPLGTLALFLSRFGWGKPVEIDPYNLKDPLRDGAVIALAGPTTNLIIAVVLSLILKTNLIAGDLINWSLTQLIMINLVLAIFNLLPIHPLDGSKILLMFLNRQKAYEYEELMHRYGMLILLAVILPWNGTSIISQIISPIVNLLSQFLI